MAVNRWAYKPSVGEKVLYDGELWVVWSQAPAPSSWWLLPYDENRTADDPMKQAVIAKTKLIQPYRSKA